MEHFKGVVRNGPFRVLAKLDEENLTLDINQEKGNTDSVNVKTNTLRNLPWRSDSLTGVIVPKLCKVWVSNKLSGRSSKLCKVK